MLVRNVRCFADVSIQIDEERFLKANSISGCDVCVARERSGSDGFLLARKMQFPLSLADGLQVDSQVIKERLVGICFVEFAVEQVRDVFTVDDTVVGHFGSGQSRKRRQDIQRAGDLVAGRSSGNSVRTPENRGNSQAALK